MSFYKKFKASERHETGGVWLDYGDSGKILVARAGGGNRKYIREIEKLSRKYRRQLQLDMLPEPTARKLFIEIFARSIVLGWEGVTNEAGEPMACTPENVVKLFTDLPDLFRDVQEQAGNLALFREEIDEEDAKN